MGKGMKLDYLTLCSVAAQEAGMSYGKYMAMHTDTTRRFRAIGRMWKPHRALQKSAQTVEKRFTTVRLSGKFIAVLIASGHSATDKPPSDTGTGKRRKERRRAMEDKKPFWEVKRDGVRLAFGSEATFPGQEERKLLRAGGHKIHNDGKICKE